MIEQVSGQQEAGGGEDEEAYVDLLKREQTSVPERNLQPESDVLLASFVPSKDLHAEVPPSV